MSSKPRKPKSVPVSGKPEPKGSRKSATTTRRPAFVSESDVVVDVRPDPFANSDPENFDAEAGTQDIDADLEAGLTPDVAKPRKRRLSFGKVAAASFGLLFSLLFGLWLDSVIQSLFLRADWLGWTATGLTALGAASLLIIAIREISALRRLSAVQSIRDQAAEAALEKNPRKARQVISRLTTLFTARPETARDRARLAEVDEDIIDGPDLVDFAESTLLTPLDRQARRLILNASKRVSVVTALSPRALIDLGYVLFESFRLIRQLAVLYGCRPGAWGMMRLTRDVIAHLAVTGTLAMGDGIVQQLLGQGVATRLSAKLGEGIVNGLMTARIGIAAMDLCRPLPFRSEKRPGIGDFIGDLTRQATGSGKER